MWKSQVNQVLSNEIIQIKYLIRGTLSVQKKIKIILKNKITQTTTIR